MLNLPIKILKTIEIETAQATIEFDDIDLLVAAWDARKHVTSRHLVLIVNAASPDAVAKRAVEITINGDAGANYNHQTLTGENAVPDADRQDAVNALFEYLGGTDYPFAIPGTTYANAFGGGTILFPHAFNVANHKVALALGGAVEDYVSAVFGRWAAVAPITSLLFAPDTGDFAVGSTFSLGVIDERYLVEEVLLAADGTPTFDNIPQGEGDLAVIGYARSDNGADSDGIDHNINDDDTAANYPWQRLIATNAAPSAVGAANCEIGVVNGGISTANAFSPIALIYSQYTKGNQPHWLSASGMHDSVAAIGRVFLVSGRRSNIEPINKLQYYPDGGTDFKAGSLFSLYRVPKRIIERFILTEDTPTITFDNIPQNFEDLILHVYARSDNAGVDEAVYVSYNGDVVAANYDWQYLRGSAAVVAALRSAGDRSLFEIPGDTEGVGEFGGGSVLILGYSKTDRHKHIISLSGRQENRVIVHSQRWESLNAINSIALTVVLGANFLAGSVFELEGVMRRGGLPPSEGMRI